MTALLLLWLACQVSGQVLGQVLGQVPADPPEQVPADGSAAQVSDQAPDPVPDKAPAESPAFTETVVVTAAKEGQRVVDAVAPTTVLSRTELERSPDLTLDDRLRQVPGFGLLRRSSSLTAHPTSQGVSLRGLGPSGASRTLVLFDGTPLNDPFGGWVAWNRLPSSAVESVEVARGALSQLYGSAALGGVVQLLPRAPRPDLFEVTARGGDHGTGDLEIFASDATDRGGWILAGRRLTTEGFSIVPPEARGAVDQPAGVDFGALYGRVTAGPWHVGLNVFSEERENGTALQRNDTRLAALEAGRSGERWEWDFHAQTERFRSTFSRLLPDRSQEFLTAEQDFETHSAGGSAAWRPGSGLLAGADLRRVTWDAVDQTLGGLYVQKTFGLSSRVDLLAGARLDLWQSGTTRTSLNPRLGVLVRANEDLTLRASAYRGFRAPTLNELYRPFRVGTVETLANPDLGEESLVGVEAGADLAPSPRLFVRVNAFASRIDGAVGNVTLSVTPQLVTRRRENLDRVEVRGAEAEARARLAPTWELRAAWLYTDSHVERTGRRVPQVPWNQGSLGIAWEGPVTVLLQARWSGDQFEDDQNLLALPSFLVADLSLRRPLGRRLEVFLAAENLFGERVVTGRLPVETVGTPRLIQGGIAVRR